MTVTILVVLAVWMLGLGTVVTVLAFKGRADTRRDIGPMKPRSYYWLNQRWSDDKRPSDDQRHDPTEQN